MCKKYVAVTIYTCGKRVSPDFKFDPCGNPTAPGHEVSVSEMGSTRARTTCGRFLGLRENGILLSQASHGNLQAYLDSHPSTRLRQRLAWCVQVAEAVDHIHGRGVVHSDLRPGNVLVHETAPGVLGLQLCDFGGSVCEELGLDGLALPDGPFYHHAFGDKSGPMLDLFGMGSVFYVILTGRWPYKATPGTFGKVDERIGWEEREVYPKFREEKFPDFVSARDVLDALQEVLESSLGHDGV
ncbi:protein kinase-like domain protein [Colletotrichum sojae]|uniref:EKC/KEOPS complex subunit BUD32 n=1 Tax=Colletotrichum sojae TaxID=2175907 RepID=A0A8H6JQ27_9PEZI|nr:protein kinase-like domain protein [Colletotrichum sojae]